MQCGGSFHSKVCTSERLNSAKLDRLSLSRIGIEKAAVEQTPQTTAHVLTGTQGMEGRGQR